MLDEEKQMENFIAQQKQLGVYGNQGDDDDDSSLEPPQDEIGRRVHLQLWCRGELLRRGRAWLGSRLPAGRRPVNSFGIVDQIPYITKDLSVGIAYKCLDLKTGEFEIFDENDITLTVPEHDTLYSI